MSAQAYGLDSWVEASAKNDFHQIFMLASLLFQRFSKSFFLGGEGELINGFLFEFWKDIRVFPLTLSSNCIGFLKMP
jgi:hypothetical protein